MVYVMQPTDLGFWQRMTPTPYPTARDGTLPAQFAQ